MATRILVLNDDQGILELFKMILEGEGHEVRLATIPFEHAREVEALAPSLVILDMKFGRHAQGMLLLEQIRLYPPTKHIPIIVCTAAVNEMREQEETFHHKGIPVIYKPFDIDELLEVVHQTLSLPLEE